MTSLSYVNECFHDFMFVNRAPPPPRKFSSAALVQSLAKSLLNYSSTIRTIPRLFTDYSYYSSTIRGLFVLFVDYSRTIRTIRRLFADYSYYSSTIRRLFVLFVDYSHYSHYSLHYSSFINCLSYIALKNGKSLLFQWSNKCSSFITSEMARPVTNSQHSS